MEYFWALGILFAAGFAILNAYAKDWTNPWFWIILGVFAIMGIDYLQGHKEFVGASVLLHPAPLTSQPANSPH